MKNPVKQRTAMVTGGLVWPTTWSVTGTALPGAMPTGTTASTWYTPAQLGSGRSSGNGMRYSAEDAGRITIYFFLRALL